MKIRLGSLNQEGGKRVVFFLLLFNEKTGERIDKYEYILRQYPDRPWMK